ncbi:thiol-disulfide oxidoreductase DCC family protein [Streptomyces sp. MB09-02B]|uniref:thiol-disulfide oxidoreductase DCC family protein n=1 Tax=Streptomyces sp. MB09-02B TaxID=3028667 RepID=UPI0029B0E498|nr:DCC1-like thiol-disulfide oxidoreductase family protein [Streptomyces sp. MB09-02B]MDX3642634.1 DCC1-like thiol-disulfide oxidoreductase family protein [Streptomyces sp. MB09-02B]
MSATAGPAAVDRGAERVPVHGLTVLYDAGCGLCAFLREWLGKQLQLVPLTFVAAGSEEARRLFPSLDHAATLEEITIVGDGGQVYRGSAAWIVCLWALRAHRPLAHRLSTPAGARLARTAVLTAAKWRGAHRQPGSGCGSGGAELTGWSYDRRYGWVYRTPGDCDSGTCPTR